VSDQQNFTENLPSLRKNWKFLTLLLVPATVVWAASNARLEKTYETNGSPRVSISNISGHVTVRGWDRSQVHVIYTVGSPRVEVDTEVLPPKGPADKIRLSTHVLDPLTTGPEQTADYTLDVPVGTSLEIRNPQGTLQVENLQSDAALESVGGNIEVTDFSGHLSVKSVGGNIQLIRTSGNVEAYSITGDLHFVSPATTKLRGSTTSGRILYEGDFKEGGDYVLSEYSGEMDIACPSSASYELRAKTVRGKILNTLPIKPRHRYASPMASSNSLLGTHNTGNATVELTSFSGTIRIRPQD
jgi:hypothetical protein